MRVVEIPPLPARLRSATPPSPRTQHHRPPTPPRQTVTITREVIVVIPEVVPAATPPAPAPQRRRPMRATLAIAVTAGLAATAIVMFARAEPDVRAEYHEPIRATPAIQPRVEPPAPRVELRVTEMAPTHESELRPASHKVERVRTRRPAKPKATAPAWDPDALFPPE
jgi:hypothetical protein